MCFFLTYESCVQHTNPCKKSNVHWKMLGMQFKWRLRVRLVRVFKNWKLLFKKIYGNTCGWKSVLKCVKCCLKTENDCLKTQTKHPLSVCLPSVSIALGIFFVPRHCSWDHQTQQNIHTHAFLGPTALFILLKIILLRYFQ